MARRDTWPRIGFAAFEARLASGVELVRIGRPERPEFAAWRYGDQLGQRRRTALIRAGLAEIADQGAAGCVVLGDPGYYQRFGFRNDGELRYADAPPQYFQSLAFYDAGAKGDVRYHRSFSDY